MIPSDNAAIASGWSPVGLNEDDISKFILYPICCLGITNHKITYNSPPNPAKKTINTHTIRTIVGSKSKYSARPAQTPPIILLFERVNLFFSSISYYIFINIQN